MRVEVREHGQGAITEARNRAKRTGCNLRAPHHTVSSAGLVGELAFAAGGILVLDEVDKFRPDTLRTLASHLEIMHPDVRPAVYLIHDGDLPEEARLIADMGRSVPSDGEFREAACQKVKDAGIPYEDVQADGDCAVTPEGVWVQVWIRLNEEEVPS